MNRQYKYLITAGIVLLVYVILFHPLGSKDPFSFYESKSYTSTIPAHAYPNINCPWCYSVKANIKKDSNGAYSLSHITLENGISIDFNKRNSDIYDNKEITSGRQVFRDKCGRYWYIQFYKK